VPRKPHGRYHRAGKPRGASFELVVGDAVRKRRNETRGRAPHSRGSVGRKQGRSGSDSRRRRLSRSSLADAFVTPVVDDQEGPLCLFTEFFKNFYNADKLLGSRVSEEVLRVGWNTAAFSSAAASLACVATWYTDFRKDVAKIVPPHARDAWRLGSHRSSRGCGRSHRQGDQGCGAGRDQRRPHNFAWTAREETNQRLVRFFG
jgi:hypothetical protein